MITNARPPFDPISVFDKCTSGIHCKTTAARLASIRKDIEKIYADYDAASNQAAWYKIPRRQDCGPVSSIELKNLYDGQMSARNGAARSIYNALGALSKANICLACGAQVVKTLDHYLPKSAYPMLAVCVNNLIPVCDSCNREKSSAYPQKITDQPLHPYFDRVPNEPWVLAELVPGSDPVLLYRANPPSHWCDDLRERVSHHFKLYKLDYVFAAFGNQTLVSISDTLRSMPTIMKPIYIRDFLHARAAEWRSNKASWQFATYSCLASDDWYCDTYIQRSL